MKSPPPFVTNIRKRDLWAAKEAARKLGLSIGIGACKYGDDLAEITLPPMKKRAQRVFENVFHRIVLPNLREPHKKTRAGVTRPASPH